METEQQPYIVPKCKESVEVLYADDDLLLVNKPAFLLSVPGKHPLNKDCMITRIQQDYPSALVVHRLDLDTSGIMVVALHKAAHRHISQQFEKRLVSKRYEAVVSGIVEDDNGAIDFPIITDWPNRPRQKVCYTTGKPSLTHYSVLTRDYTLQSTRLSLKPVTGRSHQLRIHLREIGHAILGCDLYASESVLARSPRLLLHATHLEFDHPVTGEKITGLSPVLF